MQITSINAELLAKMFLAGAKNLDAKKEWINELNVFPVPDGDTGTNMSMTIMSAAKEVSALSEPTMETLSKAISSGSLRGARGNSGVILSQLLRGFTKAIKHSDAIDVDILCEAAQRGVETAYKAVMKPKEGTILTVARGIAEKCAEMADKTDDMIEFWEEVIKHGDYVLNQTPEMLPVLKQAGVVDSGGQGLMQVLKGAYDALCGKEIDYTIEEASQSGGFVKISRETEEEIKFGYCTEFIIVLDKALSANEETAYKAYLESLGDSIVVVADDEIVKTHVHTNDPGLAIQKALTYGSLSKIKIDNMREEHQERLIKDAEKIAAEQAKQKQEEVEVSQESPVQETSSQESPAQENSLQEMQELQEPSNRTAAEPQKEMGFVAVSIGEGMNQILRGLGVDHIIEGGQTMNPSTEDMLEAIDHVNAKTVFILPNNKNIILAANQAVYLSEDKEIIVIPTTTVPQGISALVNFIPDLSAEENAEAMKEAIALVKTGQVTYAVRDTTIDGKEIHQNDFMGIGDKTILSVGTDKKQVTLDMVEEMVDEDSAIVSVYFGMDSSQEEADELAQMIGERYPYLEVETNDGGQPIYYYVISVE